VSETTADNSDKRSMVTTTMAGPCFRILNRNDLDAANAVNSLAMCIDKVVSRFWYERWQYRREKLPDIVTAVLHST
jgi:hypothetical protein